MEILKKICVPVGTYTTEGGAKRFEYRDIGVLVRFTSREGGNSWEELLLHHDMLAPGLARLVQPFVKEGSSRVPAKLFDIDKKGRPAPGVTAPAAAPMEDEDVPY